MPRSSLSVSKVMALLSTIIIVSAAAAQQSYAEPSGNGVGSCEGIMQFTSGGQSRFLLKVFYNDESDDEQVSLYFMLPGKTGLLKVIDMDFDDETMSVTAGSKKQLFEGTICSSPLKFKGSWKAFEGVITLDMNRLIDQ